MKFQLLGFTNLDNGAISKGVMWWVRMDQDCVKSKYTT